MLSVLRIAISFARRDWRAGELNLLVAALVVAVAATSSVGFFVDRMRSALALQATQLLGGDLVVASDRAIPPEFLAEAGTRGLRVARTAEFASMLIANDRTQLASVKAVTENYPLRGRLRVTDELHGAERDAERAPAPGEVWADPQLLYGLSLARGDAVGVGESRLQIARLIMIEPDRGTGFVNFAPRALIAWDQLGATGLIQPASRVTYRMILTGAPEAVAAFKTWVQARLQRGQRVESLDAGRPDLRVTLDRAEQFLSLVALLSALIAAVAVALAARRFAGRHLDGCAVIKAIGLQQGRLLGILLVELIIVAVLGALLGTALGWALHYLLASAFAPLIELVLPAPSLYPAAQALLVSLALVIGFGAWPFVRLAGVPPLRALRRELGVPGASAWVGAGVAAASFAALMFWLAGDRKIALIALGGFAGAAVVFVVVGFGVVALVGRLRSLSGVARSAVLRLALASWSRRRAATVIQTAALAIGLMALTLLGVTRTDLIEGWRKATPADAPNRFVINVQADQREAVGALLARSGVKGAELSPMVRGRLVEVNGSPVRSARYEGDRARRLVEREMNLSYMDQLPGHNRLVAGKWFSPGAREASAESGIMESLGLALGDQLTFDVAGSRVTVRLTSARKVAWDSMKVNFFMILSPAALAGMPQSLITAYHQPASAPGLDTELVRAFPNLTVFDTGNILRQVQRVLEQVIQAVQFLFVLTLVAGVVVLYGALASSRDERIREAALMRALGASRRQLAAAQLWELAFTGALAGVLAALAALVVGWALAAQVFDFTMTLRWSMLPAGALAGALLALVAGWFGLRVVVSAPPIATLRDV